ncbi:MAG: YCF48-related protein [Bacteroidales bacterium]|nr:YCF48-related protein [Bacteroidales bacterium]
MKERSKNLIFNALVVIALLISLHSSGQNWDRLSPYPTSNDLLGVHLSSDGTALIAGGFNTLMRSTDQFQTWNTCSSFPGEHFRKIVFPTPDTGFMISCGHLFMTTNAGESWIDRGLFATTQFNDIWFLDKMNGWIVGDYNLIMRTSDGGTNWEILSFSVMSGYMYESVRFITPDTGYVIGEFGYYGDSNFVKKTTDGGLTWSNVPLPIVGYEYQGLYCDAQFGLMLGTKANYPSPAGYSTCIVSTHDDGATWQTTSLTTSPDAVLDIQQPAPGKWKILTQSGMIYSNDNMSSWNHSYCFAGPGCEVWSWDGPDRALAAGYRGRLFYTEDGGINWVNLKSGIENTFYCISFADELNGIMGANTMWGNQPGIYYSHDGGESWEGWYCDTTHMVNYIVDVDMPDPAHAWATGLSGLFNSTDGGENWHWVDINMNVNSIDAKTDGNIWVGGQRGKVAHSTNNGLTWQYFGIPDTNVYISEIQFPSTQTGYAIAFNTQGAPKLFKTSDGGINWSLINYPAADLMISCMQFVSADTGFLSVRDNGFTMTTDGGVTWTAPKLIAGQIPSYFNFFESGKGVATLGDFFVAVTSDMGESWQVRRDEKQQSYWKLTHFVTQAKGWGTDWNNGIYRYTDILVSTDEQPVAKPVIWQINPNPVQISFTIQGGEPNERLYITIYDIEGHTVLNHFSVTEGIEYPLTALKPGSYLMHIASNKKHQAVKFIKQ